METTIELTKDDVFALLQLLGATDLENFQIVPEANASNAYDAIGRLYRMRAKVEDIVGKTVTVRISQ